MQYQYSGRHGIQEYSMHCQYNGRHGIQEYSMHCQYNGRHGIQEYSMQYQYWPTSLKVNQELWYLYYVPQFHFGQLSGRHNWTQRLYLGGQ